MPLPNFDPLGHPLGVAVIAYMESTQRCVLNLSHKSPHQFILKHSLPQVGNWGNFQKVVFLSKEASVRLGSSKQRKPFLQKVLSKLVPKHQLGLLELPI
jgi:hypothetical protein